MNERIKELLCQAHLDAENPNDTNWIANRFSELIIRECAKVADDTQFKYRNYPVSIAIEEHFDLPK